MDTIDPRLGIGGNNPPGAFETVRDRIEDLFGEARHWLDGKPVATQGEADAISKLLELVRKVEKEADAERVKERRPHDIAAKAVQERYRPVLDRAKLLADTCKAALTPWLRQKAEQASAAAAEARRIADEKAAAAKEAFKASGPEDIAGREAAEIAFRDATRAEAQAVRAGQTRPHAKGGTRAVSLRTRYAPEIKNSTVLARYCWERHREEMERFLLSLAEQDVRRGLRDIPGVEVIEIKEAV